MSPYLGNAADNDRMLVENDSYETVVIENIPANVDGYYLLDIGRESIIKSIAISDFDTVNGTNYYISYSIDDSDYKLIYRKTG